MLASNDSASQTVVQHFNSLQGGQEACAKWTRDRILVQGMPPLVAPEHKLSGNACVMPRFKENKVV